MSPVFKEWRRRRRIGKVKPGDGRALKPYRWWQLFSRHLFYLDLTEEHGPGDDGVPHRYAVHVSWWKSDDNGYSVAHLYREGRQHAVAPVPAIFPVPGGAIEVRLSDLGLRRMHYVSDDGEARLLTPDPRSAEGLRARWGQRHPRASSWLGRLAIMVLLGAAIVELPQLLELVTSWDPISERVGTFSSPINLPSWANISILAVSLLAAMERALTLRHHWLIDGGGMSGDFDV